ncbi:uncharacterized protein LOC132916963 [Rhopalosiphum padi]|uniref:uncharacterized protein LOC132916963 n=1 Tax=Rhopalosiphum padi TaxID=40932 RepID=UPI00298DD7E3|nr:uncharacterized protein LOC132916963 [Rhopalosiphum padi]XP_060833424.1 uncharacterized protein LOC132916963 [Rhopalosiphum padi]
MANVIETNSMESTTISYTNLALLAIALMYPALDRSIKELILSKIKIILQKAMSSKYWRIMIPLISIAIYFQIFIIWNVPFTNVLFLAIRLFRIYQIAFGVKFFSQFLSIKLGAILSNNIRINNICFTQIYNMNLGDRFLTLQVQFTILDISCYILCAAFGVYYICTEYWNSNHLLRLLTFPF